MGGFGIGDRALRKKRRSQLGDAAFDAEPVRCLGIEGAVDPAFSWRDFDCAGGGMQTPILLHGAWLQWWERRGDWCVRDESVWLRAGVLRISADEGTDFLLLQCSDADPGRARSITVAALIRRGRRRVWFGPDHQHHTAGRLDPHPAPLRDFILAGS